MPRRSILTPLEKETLLAIPTTQAPLNQYFTLSEGDISIIKQHRGAANWLGYAVQLCYLRYPGIVLGTNDAPPPALLLFVAKQLGVSVECWREYGQRDQTRREHLLEIQKIFNFRSFTAEDYARCVQFLADEARRTTKGVTLARVMIGHLRKQSIILPAMSTIERACAEVMTQVERGRYAMLAKALNDEQKSRLDNLLERKDGKSSWLSWLRQPLPKLDTHSATEYLTRLHALRALQLPTHDLGWMHPAVLEDLAEEGSQLARADLAKLNHDHRHAILLAFALDLQATLIDTLLAQQTRKASKLFRAARKMHRRERGQSAMLRNTIKLLSRFGNALLTAKEQGKNLLELPGTDLSWDAFRTSVAQASQLAQRWDTDVLALIQDRYAKRYRYILPLLNQVPMSGTPASDKLRSELCSLKTMLADNATLAPLPHNEKNTDSLPDASITSATYLRELTLISSVTRMLRTGDVWIAPSKQFRAFDDYLLPLDIYHARKAAGTLPIRVSTQVEAFLHCRLSLLREHLNAINTDITPIELPQASAALLQPSTQPTQPEMPIAAQALAHQVSLTLPRIKITELLQEVEEWTGFSQHFTHQKTGEVVADKVPLLAAILADAINISMTHMSDANPRTSYAKLAAVHSWHIHADAYAAAQNELLNALEEHPLAAYRDRPRDALAYASWAIARRSTRIVTARIEDAVQALDELLQPEVQHHPINGKRLQPIIANHLVGIATLLGFQIADPCDHSEGNQLYLPQDAALPLALRAYPVMQLDLNCIERHWDDILRLAASIHDGTASASLLLPKLAQHRNQQGISAALRELGRLERTIHLLEQIRGISSEAHIATSPIKAEYDALAKSIFFHHTTKNHTADYERNRYRPSGLGVVTAAIVLWNTVQIAAAVEALRQQGQHIDDTQLKYLSPFSWAHITFTGDYHWRNIHRSDQDETASASSTEIS